MSLVLLGWTRPGGRVYPSKRSHFEAIMTSETTMKKPRILPCFLLALFILSLPSLGFSEWFPTGNRAAEKPSPELEIVVQDGLISMDLKSADLALVLKEIGKKAKIDLAVGERVQGKITLKTAGAAIEDVLKKVCENRTIVYEYLPEKNAYRILSVGAYYGEKEKRSGKEVLPLNGHRERKEEATSTVLHQHAPGSKEKPERIFDSKGRRLYKPGEVLVRLKKEAKEKDVEALHRSLGNKVTGRIPWLRLQKVKLREGLSEQEAIELYAASGIVERAEKHALRYPMLIPNDPFYAGFQWALPKIQAPQAWEITRGNPNVVIAVIDTGVDYNHPDLKDNMWLNEYEVEGDTGGDGTPDGCPGICEVDDDQDAWETAESEPDDYSDNDGDGLVDENGIDLRDEDVMVADYDNDGIPLAGPDGQLNTADDDEDDKILAANDDDENGYADDIRGWDFADWDNDPMDAHTQFHGTHVAGIIAAAGNNALGVTGVCWNAKIMNLKVADSSGNIDEFEVIKAIGYALFNGAHLVNCSFGGTNPSPLEETAFGWLRDAGILVVCAAGNGDDNMDEGNQIYPACYDLDNILSVASSDANDRLFSSNYGPTSVDLMAPGHSIYSTNKDGLYGYFSGTSMAAPHVTGIAALLLSVDPDLDYARIKSAIMDTVDKIPSVEGLMVSGGRVNALRALCNLYSVPGDLTCDKELGLKDAIVALQIISDLAPALCPCAVDMNGDNAIGMEEAVFILQKLASDASP